MSDFISFDIKAPAEIRIKLTHSAVKSAMKLGCGTSWFKQCSCARRVLATVNSAGDTYYLHIGGNVLGCKIDSEDNSKSNVYFLAVSLEKSNFKNKNIALHSGLCFYFENGIVISYDSQNNSFRYRNGGSFLATLGLGNFSKAVKFVAAALDTKKKSSFIQEPEEYQPSAELMEYLSLADQYSQAEYELEEERALINEPLHYDGISGCDYARIANSAYRFFVDRTDDDTYPLNTKVELNDINDEKLRATIIDSGIDDENRPYVDLLFNNQLSIDSIQTVGDITLSFSSVNRDVQKKAIDKIMDGTSDARYMNSILGNASPEGFEKIDFSKLEAELSSYKYPPNTSQTDAIFKGISTKDAYLVMGPPGTGKTTVILEWIKYFVKEKKMRVLVSSQNNKAVDNVLERIIQEDGINALRIGTESKVTEQVKPCLFEIKLETLRDKIKNATDSHCDKISQYVNYWTGINLYLYAMEPYYDNKTRLENELDSACAVLDSSLSEIENTFARIQAIETKLSEDAYKINALIDKEYIYREKGAFMRFILKPFSWLRNMRIRSGVSSYDIIKNNHKQLCESYSYQCSDYIALYDKTAFEIFAPEREAAQLIEEKMKTVSIDYESNIDPWQIFNLMHCSEMDITGASFYKELTSSLQNSLQKAELLVNELKKWQSVSVDTSNYTLKNILLEEVNLVGATCIGINSQHRFSDLKFDVSIIDEAGQIQIHNVLVPMSVSNKLIMLGDHKQIPPMADDELLGILKEHDVPTELLEKSLFEDLYNRIPESNKSMLDTQYRMPSEIADIISAWFYNGEYKSFPDKSNLTSALPNLSEKPFLIIDTSDSGDIRYERNLMQGDQTVHDNPLEASIAARIVSMLVSKGYDIANVGVIAALKAQVDLIRKELRKRGITPEDANEIAATLDSYQGQERDVIIYSFGRSSKKDAQKNGVGFLTELRRLNVAMSRCKKTLIMIGDMKFLSERESENDYLGNVIADKQKTEKNFSAFIRHILASVEKGAGEVINVSEFDKRISN